MNKRIIVQMIGRILILEALLLLLPMLVALYYRERAGAAAFAITAFITAGVGVLLALIKAERRFYAREGFAIVALSWVALSLFGALPFVLSGEIPHYMDALFETISGLTTTGASILTEVESLGRGVLFWRNFTHWIGGMGVLVLIMTVVSAGEHSMHIFRAEMPGPAVEKLLPKARETAKMLYTIYLVLTALEVVLLCLGGMDLYDSLVHSFGTAGTGGFSIKNTSIAAYDSPYIHWVITIFMVLFGVNFSIYFLLLRGNVKRVLKSEELRWYLGIIAAATLIITINILPIYGGVETALRQSAFHVASVITTTGYAIGDFNIWPQLSRTILLVLMFVGASAGSTGGGIKVSRIILLWRSMRRELSQMLHPRSIKVITFDGKVVEEARVNSVNVFLVLYCAIAVGSVLLLSLDNFDFETNFTAMLACINNIGPGLSMVGPLGNYSQFSVFSKMVLSFDMLVGRLEIYPILLLLAPLLKRQGKVKG